MDGEQRDEQAPGFSLFEHAVEQARVAICFSDARVPDNPLTYVNPAFEAMTGYARAEVIGRNCRFLQGPGTDPAAVDQLRRAVMAGEPTTVEILNYRRDGSPFWNALHVAPVLDADGVVVQYYGSQLDVSAAVAERLGEAETSLVARELRHRAANLFSVFGALISLSLPRDAEPPALDLASAISARVQAMGRAHAFVTRPGADGADLGEVAESILSPLATHGRLWIEGPPVRLAERVAGPLALILHELATNAVKYGALREGAGGTLTVAWEEGRDLTLRWREDSPAPGRPGEAGTGTQIIDGVLASLGGRMDRTWTERGLDATMVL